LGTNGSQSFCFVCPSRSFLHAILFSRMFHRRTRRAAHDAVWLKIAHQSRMTVKIEQTMSLSEVSNHLMIFFHFNCCRLTLVTSQLWLMLFAG
jgi:hypothetical protein